MARRSLITVMLCLSLLAIGAAQASAVTVVVSPGGLVSLSAANTGTLQTGSGTGVAISSCTMLGRWASASAVSYPIPFSPLTTVASPADDTAGNLVTSSCTCRMVGAMCSSFSCDGAINVMAAGAGVLGVTPLRLTRIRCSISGSCRATLASTSGTAHYGGVDATFDNAGPTLSVDVPTGTNQNLGVSGSTCTQLPNGTATLSGPSGTPFAFSTASTVN